MVKVINVQPYSLREGPEQWDKIKEKVAANNLEHLRLYAPNLTSDKILATEIRSPSTSSAIIGTTGMEAVMVEI